MLMALAEPTGGAGRKTLLDSLERLRKRYAGLPVNTTRAVVPPGYPADTYPASPGGDPLGNMLAAALGSPQTAAAPGTGRTDWTTFNPADWRNGINIYNPYLGLPLAQSPNAPGKTGGEGPGYWVLDGFSPSNPFWRSDWVYTGDPNDPWDISGET